MWEKIKAFFNHKSLRELAITLNAFCIIEISVIVFFSWLAYDLLMWYKSIMTVETFDSTPFWAALGGIAASIFSALKYINSSVTDSRE